MKCKYYYDCPSVSGWCNHRQPSTECIGFIKGAIKNHVERLGDYTRVFEQVKQLSEVKNNEKTIYDRGKSDRHGCH